MNEIRDKRGRIRCVGETGYWRDCGEWAVMWVYDYCPWAGENRYMPFCTRHGYNLFGAIKLDNGQVLVNVHSADECYGRHCTIHNPSDHHMRDFGLYWRWDRHFFERICPHGIGHPDPDQVAYWETVLKPDEAMSQSIHGCDGCC